MWSLFANVADMRVRSANGSERDNEIWNGRDER